MLRLFSFLTLFVSLLLLASYSSFSQEKTVIKNVSIISFDPDAAPVVRNQDVYLAKGIIEKIKPTGTGKDKGYTVVDGSNKFLIPGMADMHVHIPRKTAQIQTKPFYLLNLLNGFTTVRQMRGNASDLALRDSIRKGSILGSNTYVSTPFFRDNDSFTSVACRDSITRYKQQGYDFVKYLWGLKPAQYDTLVSITASLNMKLTGHAPGNDLEKAVNGNQHTIEHIDPFVSLYQKDSNLFWKTIDKMAGKGLYHCPNVVWYQITGSQNPLEKKREVYEHNAYGIDFLPKDSLDVLMKEVENALVSFYRKNPVAFAKGITKSDDYLTVYKSLLGRMQKRGVKLLISATSGDFIIPGYTNIDEMAIFVAAGITPYETLKCATYNAAECMGETATWGCVAAGKRADLVLLSADPLDNIENLRKVDATILHGRVLTHDYLLKELKSYYPAH